MKVAKAQIEDIERLKQVVLEWKESCNAKDFRIDIRLETHFQDLAGLIENENSDLFLLIKKDNVIGYMGVTCFDSPLGNQRIANEHYWFVSGKHRGRGTLLLLRSVKKWAKERGCSHLIMNASNLASNMHGRLCRFYEKIGFQKFETSYIEELK